MKLIGAKRGAMTGEQKSAHGWLNYHLPPDFTIEPVGDRDQADFVIPRRARRQDLDRTIGEFVLARQDLLWPLQAEYRGKKPAQQWELTVGGHVVQLYNYVPWRRLSVEHAENISATLARFEASFPGSVQKLRAVTAVEHLKHSPYGNPRKFPFHAEAQPEAGIFAVQGPHGLRLNDHYRNQLNVNSLCALVAHEMTHMAGLDKLLAADFQEAGFTWSSVLTPATRQPKVVNGRLLYSADQPEACVTDFGTLDPEEDACDSVAAYLHHEPKLNQHKKRMIRYYDQDGAMPASSVAEVKNPGYPLIPQKITFYMDT